MSRQVEERVVKMTFDNEKFEKNMDQTLKSLKNLDKSLNLDKASEKLKTFEQVGNNIKFNGLENTISKVSDKITALDVAAFSTIDHVTKNVLKATEKVVSAVPKMVTEGGWNRALNIEQAKFLFEGMGQDIEKSMASSLQAVKGTAYGLDEAAKVASQFGASGIKAGEEMTTSLRGVAGVAAMTNSSFTEIGQIFSSVAARGKVYATDINRIAVRGVAANEVLAKSLGVSTSKITEMTRKGQISSKQFIDAFAKAFGKQATKANRTYTGSLANMRAAFSRLGATVQGTRLENLRKIFNSITPVVDRFTEKLDPIIKKINKADTASRKFTTSFLKSTRIVGGKLKDGRKIQGFVSNISEALNGFRKYLWTLIRPIRNAYNAVFGTITGPKLAKKLNSVARRLNKFFNGAKNGAKSLATSAKPLRQIFKGIFAAIDITYRGVRSFSKVIFGLFKNIHYLLTGTRKLGSGFRNLFTSIRPVFNFIYKMDVLFNKQDSAISKLGWRYAYLAQEIKGFKNIIREYLFIFGKTFNSAIKGIRKSFDALSNDTFKKVGKSIRDVFNIKDPNKMADKFARVNDFLSGKLISFREVMESFSKTMDKLPAKIKKLRKSFMSIGIIKSISKDYEAFKESLSKKLDMGGNLSAFSVFGKIVSTIFKKAYDVVLNFFNLFSKDSKNNGYTKLKESFGSIGDGFKNVFNSIKSTLEPFGQYIANFFDRFFGKNDVFSGLRSLTKSFTTTGFGVLLFQMSKGVKKLNEEGTSLGKLLKAISGTFGGLTKYLSAMQKAVKADIIMKIAKAVALLAASIAVLAFIPAEKLAQAGTTIVAIMIGLAYAMRTITPSLNQFGTGLLQINKNGLSTSGSGAMGPFAGLASALIAFGASVLLISIAVKKLGKMNPDQLEQGIKAAMSILGAMMGFSSAILYFEKESATGGSGKDFKNGFERIASAMKEMSKALVISAVAIRMIGSMDPVQWEMGLRGAILMLGMFSAVLWFLGKFVSGDSVAPVNLSKYGLKKTGKIKWGSIKEEVKSKFEIMAKAMKTMAKALVISAVAIRMIAKLDDKQITNALTGLGGVSLLFVAIGIMSSKLTSDDVLKLSSVIKAFGIFSLALVGISIAVKKLASLDDAGFLKALDMIEITSVIFAGLSLLSKIMDPAQMKAMSTGFLAMSVSLFIIAMASKKLSKLSWDDIGKALTIFVVALTAMVAVSYALGPVVVVLVAFGAACFLIGTALLEAALAIDIFVRALKKIDKINNFEELFNRLMEFLPTMLGRLIGAVISTIVGSIPYIVDQLMDTLILILESLAEKLPKIVTLAGKLFRGLVKAIIGASAQLNPAEVLTVIFSISVMTVVMQMLAYCGKLAKDAIKGIAVLGVAVGLMVVLFKFLLTDNSGEDVLKAALGLSAVMLSVVALMGVCALMSAVGAAALAGLGTIAGFIAGVGAILIALGLISKIPFVKELIDSGGALLESIGNALGRFIGGFVGGVLGGLSNALPGIASNLSAFMNNLGDFLSGLETITPDMVKAALGLVDIIMAFTAASLVNAIVTFFGGKDIMSNMQKFATGLEKLGPSLQKFSNSVDKISPAKVQAAALSARMLSEVANNLPKKGGVVQWWMGESIDFDTFGKQMEGLGESLAKFMVQTAIVDVKRMETVSKATELFVKLINAMPNTGGVAQWFTGEKTALSQFAKMLPDLAQGLVHYADIMTNGFHLQEFHYKGLNDKSLEKMKKSLEAAKVMAEIANSLPEDKSGSVLGWFTGNKTPLKTFANMLPTLGTGLAGFAANIGDLDDKKREQMSKALDSAKALASFAKELPNDPGIVSTWFSDDNKMSLSTFASQLGDLGDGLVDFANKVGDHWEVDYLSGFSNGGVKTFVEGINSENIKKAAEALTTLSKPITDLVTSAEGSELESVKNIVESLSTLNVTKFANELANEDNMKSIQESGKKLSEALANGVENGLGITNSGKKDAKSTVALNIALAFCQSMLQGMRDYLGNGNDGENPFIPTAIAFAKKIEAAFKADKAKTEFEKIGKNIDNGIANGMLNKDNLKKVKDAASKVGDTAKKATKKSLEQRSPSKAYWRFGLNNNLGLSNGMMDNLSIVRKASSAVGTESINSLSNSMDKVSNILSLDIDPNPTISPVLDLSNIQNGSKLIDTMLNPDMLSFGNGINGSVSFRNYDKSAPKTPDTYNDSNVLSAIDNLNSNVGSLNNSMSNLKVVMDSGEVVGVIAPKVDKNLGRVAALKERGI